MRRRIRFFKPFFRNQYNMFLVNEIPRNKIFREGIYQSFLLVERATFLFHRWVVCLVSKDPLISVDTHFQQGVFHEIYTFGVSQLTALCRISFLGCGGVAHGVCQAHQVLTYLVGKCPVVLLVIVHLYTAGTITAKLRFLLKTFKPYSGNLK